MELGSEQRLLPPFRRHGRQNRLGFCLSEILLFVLEAPAEPRASLGELWKGWLGGTWKSSEPTAVTAREASSAKDLLTISPNYWGGVVSDYWGGIRLVG